MTYPAEEEDTDPLVRKQIREISNRRTRLQRRLALLRSQCDGHCSIPNANMFSHNTESMIYDGVYLMDGSYSSASNSLFGHDTADRYQREIEACLREIEECDSQERAARAASEIYVVGGICLGPFHIEFNHRAVFIGVHAGADLGYGLYGSAGVCWELEVGRDGISAGKWTFVEGGFAISLPWWIYVYAALGQCREI
jgi:hypothetical protein